MVIERGSLITFHLKKTDGESNQLFVETYDEHALIPKTCKRWFKCFRSGDVNVKDKECSNRSKIFEDADLQALLDEDSTKMLKKLTKALDVTQPIISMGHTIAEQRFGLYEDVKKMAR